MDSRTEARLLRRAVEEGLIRQEVLDALPVGPPGAKARLLVHRGDLAEQAVMRLLAEAELTEITRVEVPWTSAAVPRPPEWLQTEPAAVAGGIDWARNTADTGPMPPTESLAFLDGWERYQIATLLGAGGMGQVLKAYDPQLNRHVALKFLRSTDRVQLERFLREARSQARIDHEHVCRVYETAEVKGRPYIAMQYIEGETLGQCADTLTLEQKVRILRDVAEGVQAAHRTGLIHRDLKPGNILVEQRDDGALWPFVVDFGLAHDQDNMALTRSGAVTGTPSYLSPEQAQGKAVDRRSDVYSLGVVLYELLAARLPLEGASIADALIKVVTEQPPPLRKLRREIPKDLETITMKCLEKEPQRRYDSSRALSEDLGRYLDGVPILARPASLADRAVKWVRRNRAMAWVLSGATASLLLLATISLNAYLAQARRGRLLQRFEREVAASEMDMRLASFLPLHDLRPAKEALKGRLEHIREEMATLGEVSFGPGRYALGRGHLALHDHELALEHLEAAWEAGERRPEVALALAEALRRLYQKALLAIDSSLAAPGRRPLSDEEGEKQLRGKKLESAESQYQRAALRYLAAESTSDQRTPYVEALIAFFSHRLGEARQKANAAASEDRWYYDARQLLAEIEIEEADGEWARGNYNQAIESFDHAGAVYAELLELGRSDPNLYAAECGRLVRVNTMNADFRRFSEELAARAVERCNQALDADRDLAEAYTRKSHLYWLWGRSLRPADRREKLELAIAMADQAILRNPRELLAFRSQGLAHLALGRIAADQGHDPSPHLEAAEASLKKALEIQPSLAETLSTLGNVYTERADYEKTVGRDPRPMLRLAVDRYRESQQAGPVDAMAWNNRGNALLTWAEFEMEEGRDPGKLLDSAEADLRRASELNPNSPRYHNNLALAFLDQGAAQAHAGEDPTAAYDKAIATLDRAIELNPSYATARPNLTIAYRGKAEHALDSGQDPSASLGKASEQALTALAASGEDFDVLLELARIHRLEAAWAVKRGADPGRALDRAASFLARAEAANEGALELHEESARLWCADARWSLDHGRHAEVAITNGLAAADRCLAAKPGLATALAAKAELLWLASGKGKSAAGADLARQARELLARALEADPRLGREVAALRAEMGGG